MRAIILLCVHTSQRGRLLSQTKLQSPFFSLLSILHQSQHKHNNSVAEKQRRGASVQRLRTLLQTARHQSTAVKEERGHPIQV